MTDAGDGAETGDEQHAPLAEAGSALADAVEANLAGWTVRCVERRVAEATGTVPDEVHERAVAAGDAAARDLSPRVRALLAADVDEQSTTPLAIVRDAVQYATAVLDDADVPAAPRDGFARDRFPDDRYDLTPANLGALGEDVGELAIVWGAAKAWEHRRRHGG